MQMTYAPTLFAEAARSLGYHPFPQPSANLSQAYTNPLGVTHGAMHLLRLLRAVRLRQLFEGKRADLGAAGADAQIEFRGAHRMRGAQDQSRRLAASVPPASPMWTLPARNGSSPATSSSSARSPSTTCRCCCISGIGQPYDPSTRQGTVGRNYAYQTTSGLELFFDDKIFNPFIASGALGQVVDDFNGDTFDHGKLGFVGGAGINTGPTNGRPIQTRPMPPGRRAGARSGSRRPSSPICALFRSARRARATRPTPTISISIPPTRTASAGRCCG